MKIFFLIFIFSICKPIGVDALGLPSSAQSLAISNTGIASPLNSHINASFQGNTKDSGSNLVSFSSNYWFEGLSGKTITNRSKNGKHEISINSFYCSSRFLRNLYYYVQVSQKPLFLYHFPHH